MRRVSYRYIERDACLQLILNNAIKLKMTKSIHLYLHIHATPLLTIVSRGQAFHVSPQDFLLVLDAVFLAIVLFWAAVFFCPSIACRLFSNFTRRFTRRLLRDHIFSWFHETAERDSVVPHFPGEIRIRCKKEFSIRILHGH